MGYTLQKTKVYNKHIGNHIMEKQVTERTSWKRLFPDDRACDDK